MEVFHNPFLYKNSHPKSRPLYPKRERKSAGSKSGYNASGKLKIKILHGASCFNLKDLALYLFVYQYLLNIFQ
ncbi:hypothetical protein HQ29_02565 [Porphyromonas canoris]|nr:hypothetical protein HQ29_02565 [Porphyromonas canoris]